MSSSCLWVLVAGIVLAGCASVGEPPERRSAQTPVIESREARLAAQLPDAPRLKRRIAVGRFINATNYGKALLRPGQSDPIADLVADMLVNRLVDSDRFIVFERDDLEVVERETGSDRLGSTLPGVDALIVGSLTQFGRRTDGQSGFLSSTKRQSVEAAVEVRLVDVNTGRAFFSAEGRGSSATEAGEVAGFGSRAGYDATLNDQAISAAVDDLVSAIVSELSDRVWATDILQIRNEEILIAGGSKSGLVIGDVFVIETRGETVQSPATGGLITLPGQQVATIDVVSFFGDDELSEGSITRIRSGAVPANTPLSDLIVREER